MSLDNCKLLIERNHISKLKLLLERFWGEECLTFASKTPIGLLPLVGYGHFQLLTLIKQMALIPSFQTSLLEIKKNWERSFCIWCSKISERTHTRDLDSLADWLDHAEIYRNYDGRLFCRTRAAGIQRIHFRIVFIPSAHFRFPAFASLQSLRRWELF